MRLVLDTNVVVSAILWDGAPGSLLRRGQIDANSLYTSRPLLIELARVLSRPKFAKKIAASGLLPDQLVELYAGYVNLVNPVSIGRVVPDPDDDVVLGTALAAKADSVVTGDKGLLAVRGFEGCRIVDVREALEAIREK
jgi:uncharacterized protein